MKVATFMRICRPFVKLHLLTMERLNHTTGYVPVLDLLQNSPIKGASSRAIKLSDGYVAICGSPDTVKFLARRAKG